MANCKLKYSRESAEIVAKVFGENLARIRRELDISRAELSRLVGMSAESIRLYETGENVPPLDRAFDIACALHVPLVELLGAPVENEERLLNEAAYIHYSRAQRAQETLQLAGFRVQPLPKGAALVIPPSDLMPRGVAGRWESEPEPTLSIFDFFCTFDTYDELWLLVEKVETDAVNHDEPLRPLLFEYMQRKMNR